MARTSKALGLAAVVAAGVLVPLYGATRSAPVTHPEWARMLLRALDLEDDLPSDAGPALVFSTLSWKNSLSYPAERYLRARGAEVVQQQGVRQVVAREAMAEVAYPLTVVRAGDYRLRVQMAGSPGARAAAEISPVGVTQPVREFEVLPPPAIGWIEAGAVHLQPGAYTAAVMLPAGSSLQRVEVAPPCLAAIEPPGGWQPQAVLQAEDVAVTGLETLDQQAELPPAAAPIELTASDFRTTMAGATASVAAEPGLQGLWLKGGVRGVQALAVVDLPEPGLYTLWSYGLPDGLQGWLVDACQKAILCPAPEVTAGPNWRPVVTAPFAAGRHSFLVTLAPGGAVGRVRLERKKDAPADYMATLARLGFDVGPSGPMPRDRAAEAMRFLKERRARLAGLACGDVQAPAAEAALAEPATPTGPGGSPGFTGRLPSGVGVPLPAPAVAPPVTAPPVTTPAGPPPTTPPVTTPPGPPPTVPPGPPPTIPPQPPGSPVTVATPPPPGP